MKNFYMKIKINREERFIPAEDLRNLNKFLFLNNCHLLAYKFFLRAHCHQRITKTHEKLIYEDKT